VTRNEAAVALPSATAPEHPDLIPYSLLNAEGSGEGPFLRDWSAAVARVKAVLLLGAMMRLHRGPDRLGQPARRSSALRSPAPRRGVRASPVSGHGESQAGVLDPDARERGQDGVLLGGVGGVEVDGALRRWPCSSGARCWGCTCGRSRRRPTARCWRRGTGSCSSRRRGRAGRSRGAGCPGSRGRGAARPGRRRSPARR